MSTTRVGGIGTRANSRAFLTSGDGPHDRQQKVMQSPSMQQSGYEGEEGPAIRLGR